MVFNTDVEAFIYVMYVLLFGDVTILWEGKNDNRHLKRCYYYNGNRFWLSSIADAVA